MIDVTRLLNSVGKKIFVDYYQDFKKKYIDKDELAQKLLYENPNAKKIGGQITRISCAQRIFANNLNLEALSIILSSNRLNNETLAKARRILNEEMKM